MSSISSTSGNRNEITDQYASQQAEKEKLRAEHEAEMERLKKTYSSEKQNLEDRFETSMQSEKLQTYDNLRNTKKQFTKAEKNLKDAGEERIQQKADEYRKTEAMITKEGTAKVDAALKKQAAIEEYQRTQANAADTLSRHDLSHNAQLITKDAEQKIDKLRQEKIDTLDRRRAEHGVAVNQIKEHYDQRQNRMLAQHDKETKHIQEGIDKQINDSQLSNSHRLDVHMEKQNDPFYHMSHVDSDFVDEGDFYQLKVRLPEYERKGFRVQISGQELQFSGLRNSNQKAEVFPGHEVSTNTYQSFSERYKFDTPVDANAMQMVSDGEWMYYTIPKYGPNHRMQEDNVRTKLNKKDMEMAHDLDFKDTLPAPKMVKDIGSGTIS
jgi:HSP20 family molecular chaperone IbpA